MADGNGTVLTLREVAKRLRVHPITIHRLIRGAKLPAFRIGRVWRFNSEELDSWLIGARRRLQDKDYRGKRFEQYVLARRCPRRDRCRHSPRCTARPDDRR